MSYTSDTYGSRREFSFTLEDDIYIRYLSFEDANGWQAECLKRLPHKMDMGAIFSAPVHPPLCAACQSMIANCCAAQAAQRHQGERVPACRARARLRH